MSNLLYRWGRAAARHPWRMIGAWVLVAIAVFAVNSGVGGDTTTGYVTILDQVSPLALAQYLG
mgnify:CR=1 FL=1